MSLSSGRRFSAASGLTAAGAGGFRSISGHGRANGGWHSPIRTALIDFGVFVVREIRVAEAPPRRFGELLGGRAISRAIPVLEVIDLR
jgi:hypothetical protein